jgi:hypothetical protein
MEGTVVAVIGSRAFVAFQELSMYVPLSRLEEQ